MVEKNNLIEIRPDSVNSDGASYVGTVTVTTYLGERILQKETHHNQGTLRLFKFISSCLQGNWYEAKFNRPCKLVLLQPAIGEKLLESEKEDPAYSTPKSKPEYWSPEYAACSPMLYDNAAIAETNETNLSSSVTYHFRIPFLKLISGAKIKKLLLLPSIASDYAAEACAYFILDSDIKVPEEGKNFTVIIDWTLTFKNSPSDKGDN